MIENARIVSIANLVSITGAHELIEDSWGVTAVFPRISNAT